MHSTSRDAPSVGEMRRFARTMTIACAIIAALLYWRGRAAAPWLASVALAFGGMGLVAPLALAPVHRAWMALAAVLSTVSTFVILAFTYAFVITPIGLLLRVLGKDLLQLRIRRDAPTYWAPVEIDGPASRSDRPY